MSSKLPLSLLKLYGERFVGAPEGVCELSPTASGVRLFKIESPEGLLLGRSGMPRLECETLLYLYNHFKEYGVPLARVYAGDSENGALLQQYLGETTLLSYLEQRKGEGGRLNKEVLSLFRKVLDSLVIMQIEAGIPLLAGVGERKISYGRDLIRQDLEYYERFYLQGEVANYDDKKLGKELDALADHLATFKGGFFYYRDLNTRNVLIHDNTPYFIDYQGGRVGYIGCLEGPLEVSVVSLINHPRAALEEEDRRLLLEYYLSCVEERITIDRVHFQEGFELFAIVKLLQILGYYGRLRIEGRSSCLAGDIAGVQDEVRKKLSKDRSPFDMPELFRVLKDGGIVRR